MAMRTRGRLASRYALGGRISRWLWAALVGFGLVVGGCSGFAEQARSEPEADEQAMEEAMETAGDLYTAMVEVFEEETEGIDEERQEALAVISVYEEVGASERRRVIGQVVPLRGGLGVQVRVEYQSEEIDEEGNVIWEDRPREEIRQQAEPLESRLVRAVERQYHRGPR